jgi:hypothetical protein
MKLLWAAVAAMLFFSPVAAETVPLPKQRPATQPERQDQPVQAAPAAPPVPLSRAPAPRLQDLPFGNVTPSPSACDRRLAELAQFTPMQGMTGPGECGAADVVKLEAVRLREGTRVALNPPAVLRCSMAEAVAHFLREEVAPAAAELGGGLSAIVGYNSYECRGRNRVNGARISEHGKGNAIDIRGIRLDNGTVVDWTSSMASKPFRERVRLAACGRFNTVLGPGSDPYHENHIHLDLAERARGYKMCQWDVREPPGDDDVPLPKPRPPEADGE